MKWIDLEYPAVPGYHYNVCVAYCPLLAIVMNSKGTNDQQGVHYFY